MKHNVWEYIEIAKSTEAFTPAEIDVLRDVLEEYQKNPNSGYVLLEEKDGESILGFLIYGPTPMTEASYDLYWIIVGKNHQKCGIGKKLLLEMENDILAEHKKASIRIETSGKNSYANTRLFYESMGYEETGRIKDFYCDGDDLIIYCKKFSY